MENSIPLSPQAPPPIHLRIELDRRINFAMQQNDVPVVKAIHVENISDQPLRDVRLSITAEPAFAEPWEWRLAYFKENSTYRLDSVDLSLSPALLGGMTERTKGKLWFSVFAQEKHLADHVEPMEILARDEWSGTSSLPEILAAFVMPNHPAVDLVLRDAAVILQEWTGDASLSGYQPKDRRRAFQATGAIYESIKRLDLSYINPPASFETEGQRIRLPDRILKSRLATCLDLAVFAAGCVEQAGLFPLLILSKDHAFLGVWLDEECFGEPVVEDPLRIRKRVDLGEIAVFDPTCVTGRPYQSFNVAVKEAVRRLGVFENFSCAIDIRRARKGKIHPIPDRIEREREMAEDHRMDASTGPPQMPDLSALGLTTTVPFDKEEEETPSNRLTGGSDVSLTSRSVIAFSTTKRPKKLFLCCARTYQPWKMPWPKV